MKVNICWQNYREGKQNVCCEVSRKTLGIGTQDLEKETDVVFYDRVYQANVQPSLVKVNRGWLIN